MNITTASINVDVIPIIRTRLFDMWINGCTDKEALAIWGNGEQAEKQAHSTRDNMAGMNCHLALIQNQYRMFDELVPFLRRPAYFACQHIYFPFSQNLKALLVERFFAFDQSVMRELIGKKLVGRTRRDLDDVSDCTGVPLASCRRQFDNLCEVARVVHDSPADIFTLMRRSFLLSPPLIQSYTSIILLNHHQVDVNQNPSVRDLPLEVALQCAHVFISHWSIDQSSLSFDSVIAHDVRDIRTTMMGHPDEWNRSIMRHMSQKVTQRAGEPTERALRTLVKNILQIGSGLVQLREIKDFIIDISDLIVAPIVEQLNIDSNARIDLLFDAITHAIISDLAPSSFLNSNERPRSSLMAICNGISACAKAIIAANLCIK